MDAVITIPTPASLEGVVSPYHVEHSLGFVRTHLAASGQAWREADLGTLTYDALPIEVDGVRCAIDFNEWDQLTNHVIIDKIGRSRWLKQQRTEHCGGCGWFPMRFAADLDLIELQVRQAAGSDPGWAILAAQRTDYGHDDRVRRRFFVRGLLDSRFGDRCDFHVTDFDVFSFRMLTYLCYVHVYGWWPGIMDRSAMLCFALGGCLVSAPIRSWLGTAPPEPWRHYVPIEDPDLWDVAEKVAWVIAHPGRAAQIGRIARALYLAEAAPVSYWAQLRARLKSAPLL